MLTAKFTLQQMETYVVQQTKNAARAVLDTYLYAGEQFINNARLSGNYNDITGNLRSSIGYVILQDGKQININFTEAGVGSDGATGVQIGLSFAELIAEEYPKGLILICVAGMDYAAAVEAKGRDVITGSAGILTQTLKSLLSSL